MMNKKGQVLVVFILLLPLIIIFLGLVVDIGNSLITKKKYENIIKDIILYNYKDVNEDLADDNSVIEDGMSEETDSSEETPKKEADISLIEKNIKDSIKNYEEINIKIENEVLIISMRTQYKGIFSKIFKIGLNTIDLEIKYDINDKKIVRE